MAIPKPEPGDWLKAAADELRQGDRATLKLLQETYRHINSILKGLPNQPDAAFGNLIYRAQLERTKRELLDAQSKLFDKLGDQVSARRLRAATRAAKLSTAATNALLLLVGGGEEGKRLYDGAVITAQRTVETMLARIGLSKVPLSERIYKTKVWMNGRLDRLIAQTMASGLNAQRFAKVARDWFAPSVPGGTRYAAYRLARTEINNAFHATSISYAQGKPWVSQMDWNLSKSHPAPDKCDEYAALSPWNVTEVPRKPHPQCMCYVTEVTPDEDEWIDRFVAGEFDDYLDSELAKSEAGVDSAQQSSTGPVNVQKTAAQMASGTSIARRDNPAYKKDYERGWRAGAGRNDLSQADKRGEPAAYYDGFSDRSIGEPKWTRADERDEIDRQRQQIEKQRKVEVPELTGLDAFKATPVGLHKRGTLQPKERKAFRVWESGWFIVINNFLREKQGTADRIDSETQATVDQMDSAFSRGILKDPIQTWRGLYKADRLFKDSLNRDLTGFTWKEHGYTSTTYVEKITDDFMLDGEENNVKVIVHVDAGVGAVEVSTDFGNKTDGGQAEIALQRGTRWQVIKDHGKHPTKGYRLIEVRVSPDPTTPTIA